VERPDFPSEALDDLRRAGVKVMVPLVAHGELIGVLYLGPRLSQTGYSTDDLRLLERLASQAAPAVRMGQVVGEQESQARERERYEQEMRVAQLIQQQFLLKDLPDLKGWSFSTHYQPAREVGGDFYDVIELDGGRIGIVVGDVTGKGVPAALVMATTRSMLRSEAPRLGSPGLVLERVNDLLVPDIPASMFVTCLYAVVDPGSGEIVFANAGHNLPYVWDRGAPGELRATGMPLGLMETMTYEEERAVIRPGQTVLFHSDGVAEAHGAEGIFGFPRLKETVAGADGGSVVDEILRAVGEFTGPGWEQEDDITLLALTRTSDPSAFATDLQPAPAFEVARDTS
jgi:serine phosphatase RsbU (regulator of sigma subunit)